MSELKAASETVFINTALPKPTTTVDYKIDLGQGNLWRRYVGQPWTREDLIAGAASSQQAAALEKEGTRTTPGLNPGDVIQYGILTDESLNPNTTNLSLGRFEKLVTIYALLQVTGPSNWLDPRPTMSETGGTFHFRRIGTTTPTYAVMKVGLKAPKAGQFELDDIETPVATLSSLIGTLHAMEAVPLVPGTPYHVVVRLSDGQGNWSIIKETFTTKQRKFRVDFEEIHIHDDSDFDLFGIDDNGEAKFWLKVYKGKQKEAEFSFGEVEISDKPAMNKIPISFSHTIQPEPFNGNDPGVGIGVEGKEYDRATIFWTIFYSTDEADTASYTPGFFSDTQAFSTCWKRERERVKPS